MTTSPATDPERWSTDVVVADGGVLHLRPMVHDDGPALLAFIDRLSDESRYYRFMSKWRPRTLEDLARFLDVDNVHRVALVAELADEIVAVGRYMFDEDRGSAEVAFTVDDRHQLRGIGTLLLEHLAAIARTNGISRFHAETLGDNQKMLRVFAHAGYRVHRSLDQGVWEIDFTIDDTPTAALAERESIAEAASVRRILAPGSVAVVGASPRAGNLGQAIVRNLLDGGFTGAVHAVHPRAEAVAGVTAYPSLREVPGPVDLVIVAVAADAVAAIVEAAGEIGVGGAVIVSTGFAETGVEGLAAQTEIVRIAHRHGLRVVGPSCIGVANTDAQVALHATISPVEPLPGVIGFASQSGALGLAIVASARRLGLGFSSFVSLGNKADVSGNDLLQYWLHDDATRVGMLHLESLGNPRKFVRLARRFSLVKPLVVVTSWRSAADPDPAPGRDLDRAEAFTAAMFDQAGVIRVVTLQELLDVGRLLAHQPLPAGRRVAVVTDSFGPGVLAVDACRAAGLELAPLSASTQRQQLATIRLGLAVAEVRPDDPTDRPDGGASTTDEPPRRPVSDAERLEGAVRLVLADPAVDAVLVVHADPMGADPSAVAAAVACAVGDGPAKPVAACFLAPRRDEGEIVLIPATAPDGTRRDVPVFEFPEAPAAALGRIAAHAAWRHDEPVTPTELDGVGVGVAAARLCVAGVLAADPDGRDLTEAELEELLATVGVTVTTGSSPAGTSAAPDAAGPDGIGVVVGVVHHRAFGQAVTFGIRGIATELLGDRPLRLVPLHHADAVALIDAPRAAPLLSGLDETAPANRAALVDLVLRVSRLADAVPELVELSLDPVVAGPEAVTVTGARGRLGPATEPRLGPRRHLDRP
jgi:acyl-CoA synthetase (NDP forming)/GNAT superfamily N-acetyltransferase